MLLIIRCNNLRNDPRVQKYIDYLDRCHVNYKLLGWNRLGEKLDSKSGVYLQLKSSYGNGGLLAIFHRIRWMSFVVKYLVLNRSQFDVIHACDLDSAFPACLYKFLFKRNLKVIFDIFDWFSATLYNNGKIVKYVFHFMEHFTIKYSDEVIICEPERIKQIPFDLNNQELVLPNIPSVADLNFLKESGEYHFNNNLITLSYVGGFYEDRLLDELLMLVEKGKINLLIAGFGNSRFEERCEKMRDLLNFKYYGKVCYKDSLNIMYNSDILYAMYSKKNPNHYYAAPNKYYETMFLGKPILSTKGLILEKKILDNGIGYTVGESLTEIESLISNLNREDMEEKGQKAKYLWNSKYKNMTNDFMKNSYMKIIS